MNAPVREWITRLRDLARPSLAGTPVDPGRALTPNDRERWVAIFRDESGVRRRVDRPFLAHLAGADAGRPDPHAEAEERLWWMVHDPAADPFSVVDRRSGPLLVRQGSHGPGWPEAERCAIHALRTLGDVRASDSIADRSLRAAASFGANLEPGDAAGLPWAVHVFIELGARGDDDAASLADNMLTRAGAVGGRAGRLEACILAHGARALERLAES